MPVADGDRLRADVLAVEQPLGGEAGHEGGELRLEEVVPVAGEVEEPLVAPDDVIGVGPEEDDGQRGGEHGPTGGGIDAARDAVEVAQDLLLAFGDARAQIEVEQQHGRDLAQAQGGVEQAGEHGEDEAQREEGAEAGVGEP